MKFVIDIPDVIQYGNIRAFLRGWLSGFSREPRQQNPYQNVFRRGAWERGWELGSAELKHESWRRNGRHIHSDHAVFDTLTDGKS